MILFGERIGVRLRVLQFHNIRDFSSVKSLYFMQIEIMGRLGRQFEG